MICGTGARSITGRSPETAAVAFELDAKYAATFDGNSCENDAMIEVGQRRRHQPAPPKVIFEALWETARCPRIPIS